MQRSKGYRKAAETTRDTSIRDPERLQALTSAANLAEIPADRDARISPIAIDQAPGSLRAEAYRRLRTVKRLPA